jgi:hypothetical protein
MNTSIQYPTLAGFAELILAGSAGEKISIPPIMISKRYKEHKRVKTIDILIFQKFTLLAVVVPTSSYTGNFDNHSIFGFALLTAPFGLMVIHHSSYILKYIITRPKIFWT